MIVGVVSEHNRWKGSRHRKLRVHRMLSRVGDNHQIFPEDGHRVAFADHGVNGYSVNSYLLDAPECRWDAFPASA